MRKKGTAHSRLTLLPQLKGSRTPIVTHMTQGAGLATLLEASSADFAHASKNSSDWSGVDGPSWAADWKRVVNDAYLVVQDEEDSGFRNHDNNATFDHS